MGIVLEEPLPDSFEVTWEAFLEEMPSKILGGFVALISAFTETGFKTPKPNFLSRILMASFASVVTELESDERRNFSLHSSG